MILDQRRRTRRGKSKAKAARIYADFHGLKQTLSESSFFKVVIRVNPWLLSRLGWNWIAGQFVSVLR